MKKRLKNILSVSICLSILLSGCAGKNDTYDKNEDAFRDAESNEEVYKEDRFNEITSYFGWLNDNPLQLQEDGSIKSQITVATEPTDNIDIGVMCFVDGYIQPISINGGDEQIVNVVTTSEDTTYDIEFMPVSYNDNEDTRVDIISLLNPTLEINKDTNEEGLSFAISQPFSAIFNKEGEASVKDTLTVFPTIELTSEFINRWNIMDGANRFADAPLVYFDVENENGERKIKADNGVIDTTLTIYGGDCEKYNLYVLVDNKVAKISDNDYIRVNTNLDMITTVDVNIDISEITDKEYVGVYAILVPDGEYKGEFLSVKKSPLIFVDNTNE